MSRIPLFFRARLSGVLAAALCCTSLPATAQASADSSVNLHTTAATAAPSASQAVDFNQATEAQLDGLHGVGPATTRRILQARHERPFSDWADVIHRVRGVGSVAAARYSAQGFVVNGARFVPLGDAAATPALPAAPGVSSPPR